LPLNFFLILLLFSSFLFHSLKLSTSPKFSPLSLFVSKKNFFQSSFLTFHYRSIKVSSANASFRAICNVEFKWRLCESEREIVAINFHIFPSTIAQQVSREKNCTKVLKLIKTENFTKTQTKIHFCDNSRAFRWNFSVENFSSTTKFAIFTTPNTELRDERATSSREWTDERKNCDWKCFQIVSEMVANFCSVWKVRNERESYSMMSMVDVTCGRENVAWMVIERLEKF
jgi:hypothetical protein